MQFHSLLGLVILLAPQIEAYDCDNPDLPKEFGLYIIDNIKPPKHNDDYVFATLPMGFSIRQSNIPNAGLGVFAETAIPKNTRLGPYDGLLYSPYSYTSINDSSYVWTVTYSSVKTSVKHYVDAKPKTHSSWLRYVNMANTIDQENLWHLQLNYEVYYVTQECIQPGTELLVWYGSGYGSRLGLTRTTDDYMRRWNETKWKTHLVNPQLINPPEKIRSQCFKFYSAFRYMKPPGDDRKHVFHCMPGKRYDVCKYVPCDVNPCTGEVDCKDCKDYCYHMGSYVRPSTDFRLVDNVNTCVCFSNVTATCSTEFSTYMDMCRY